MRANLLSNSSKPTSTLNGTKDTPRAAQIAESNCLTEPDAKFLGVEYLSSSFSICSLIFWKVGISINASPLTTNFSLQGIDFGTFTKTLALWVISSPISPSPRVAASVITPFSQVIFTVSPSSFKARQPPFCSAILYTSSALLVLARLSRGMSCETLLSSLNTSYPGRMVGEFLRTQPVSFSSADNSSNNASYSASDKVGLFLLQYSSQHLFKKATSSSMRACLSIKITPTYSIPHIFKYLNFLFYKKTFFIHKQVI